MPVGGFAGWAPGAILWDMPIYAGVGLVCLFVPGVTKGIQRGSIGAGDADGGAPPLVFWPIFGRGVHVFFFLGVPVFGVGRVFWGWRWREVETNCVRERSVGAGPCVVPE